MKDKIIVWIGTTMFNFFLAKLLQEKYDCDLYAIIDITNRPKKFFKEQQIVKFQKIWFFHDHISKKREKPDINYLASFEQKYKIHLWKLAFNERIFYDFNRYYKFSTNEILSILEQECKLFEHVLDEVAPDFMVTQITDLHHTQLFYELCKARGIKILMMSPARFGNRLMISEVADKFDRLGNSANTSNITRTFEDLQKYLKDYDYSKTLGNYLTRFHSSKLGILKALLRFLFLSDNNNEKTHFTYYGRTKLKVIQETTRIQLKERYRKSFLNRHLSQKMPSHRPYIYFPLHLEQERVLLLGAPFYTNQMEVIKNIVKSLPIGYKLFVKEHPTMSTRGWRPISDYRTIMEMPNVELVHPNVKNDDLIENSSLVITISGTSALEAAFYKKPSIVFTEMAFSVLPSVYTLKTIEELPQAIRSSLQKEVNVSDLNTYVNLVDANSFEINWWEILNEIDHRFYYEGFLVDVELREQDMLSFLEEYKSKFELVALEHIKKIKQFKERESKNLIQ